MKKAIRTEKNPLVQLELEFMWVTAGGGSDITKLIASEQQDTNQSSVHLREDRKQSTLYGEVRLPLSGDDLNALVLPHPNAGVGGSTLLMGLNSAH